MDAALHNGVQETVAATGLKPQTTDDASAIEDPWYAIKINMISHVL